MGSYKQALLVIVITLGLLSWGAVQHSSYTKSIHKNSKSLDKLSLRLSQSLLEFRSLYHQLNNEIKTKEGEGNKLWSHEKSDSYAKLKNQVSSILNENSELLEDLNQHLNQVTLPLLDSFKIANSKTDLKQLESRIDDELVYLNSQIDELFVISENHIKKIEDDSIAAHKSIKLNYFLVLLSFAVFLVLILKLALKVMKLQHQTKGLFVDMKQPISFNGHDEMSNLAISLEKMRQEVVHRRVLLQEERQQYKKHLKVRDESITHLGLQIRNSLNSIIGTLSMFKKVELNDKVQGWLRVITSSSHHLQDQVFNLLNYSILEPDEKVLEHKDFHLNSILDQVGQDLELMAQQKKLELEIQTLSLDCHINGDPWRLRQIMMKLCGYTIKYTDHGKISLEFQVSELDAHRTQLKMILKAPGVQLTSQKYKDVQAWFDNPDVFSIDHKDEAMLDLIIIGRMVDLMKGEVTHQDSENASSLEFNIPFDLCETKAALPSQTESDKVNGVTAQESNVHSAPKTALVVDDNPMNAQMVVSMMEMMDVQCEVASNGKEAIEKFGNGQQKKFDLVLMDCLMPVMNGYEATSEIRKLENGFRTPIIAVTAKSNALEREECLSHGMDDHLSKPYKLDDLQEMVKKFL